MNRLLIILAVGLSLPAWLAAQNTLVLGDSGSEEYALEVVFSRPQSSNGHQAKNWVELLARDRSAGGRMDFGRFRQPFGQSLWPDIRTYGYEGNFSFPGNRSEAIVDIIEGNSLTDKISQGSLFDLAGNWADRVVVFLGANDLRDDYDGIYERESGAADEFVNGVLGNIEKILKFLQSRNPDLQVVVVNVPDVGASPDEKKDHPDPQKRQIVQDTVAGLNRDLEQLAGRYGAAVADIFSTSVTIEKSSLYQVGEVLLLGEGHPDNDTRHLFTRDDFHPNTGAQWLYARAIIDAFNLGFGANIDPVTDQEILRHLGLGECPLALARLEGSGRRMVPARWIRRLPGRFLPLDFPPGSRLGLHRHRGPEQPLALVPPPDSDSSGPTPRPTPPSTAMTVAVGTSSSTPTTGILSTTTPKAAGKAVRSPIDKIFQLINDNLPMRLWLSGR